VLRRGAIAVTVVIVLPYLLAITALPAGVGDWVLRITPAAAIAVEQSIPAYPQVTGVGSRGPCRCCHAASNLRGSPAPSC